jgi:hypothetical protein
VVAGLLDLYEAGGGTQWLQWAVQLQVSRGQGTPGMTTCNAQPLDCTATVMLSGLVYLALAAGRHEGKASPWLRPLHQGNRDLHLLVKHLTIKSHTAYIG